jgi:hypothetical protein
LQYYTIAVRDPNFPKILDTSYKMVDLAVSPSSHKTTMRDILDTLQSSLLLWTLSLIPSNIFHYGALGGASVFLLVYAVHSNLPSAKLSRVYEIITVVEELLTRAKDKCTRDYSFLAESETLLLRYLSTHLARSSVD